MWAAWILCTNFIIICMSPVHLILGTENGINTKPWKTCLYHPLFHSGGDGDDREHPQNTWYWTAALQPSCQLIEGDPHPIGQSCTAAPPPEPCRIPVQSKNTGTHPDQDTWTCRTHINLQRPNIGPINKHLATMAKKKLPFLSSFGTRNLRSPVRILLFCICFKCNALFFITYDIISLTVWVEVECLHFWQNISIFGSCPFCFNDSIHSSWMDSTS